MCEEELLILQNIQYAIDNYDKFEFGDFEYDDIKGLVDLYIKEKEKNKRLTQCHYQYEEMTGIDLLLPDKLDVNKNKMQEYI